MLWCDTCQKMVQPCAWCHGTGMRKGRGTPCVGCVGTGKSCHHEPRFTEEEQEQLVRMKARYKRGWTGPGEEQPGGVS